jgi:hypothetical protein
MAKSVKRDLSDIRVQTIPKAKGIEAATRAGRSWFDLNMAEQTP